jgi:SAM-dependent methyltransferase
VLNDPARYGDAFADVYDDWYDASFDTASAVDALAALAGHGPVLELGVGTGRLAIPLADRGLAVAGVDASAAMLERLAAKDGGDGVHAVLADMADLPAADELSLRALPVGGGGFSLVFAAYNTFLNLDTEEAQRACLRRCAGLLAEGGTVVVEAFVPVDGDVARTSLDVRSVTVDAVVLTATEVDVANQVVTGQHVEIGPSGVRLRPWRVRYLRPAQLDAMAASCGLTLVDRWGGWDRRPFDDDCDTHVSLYRRTGGDTPPGGAAT